MPPAPTSTPLLLSPAELNYLHTSLSQTPPLRPDGRTPTQFRPLIAETALLPATNGSARVCWSEGEECIVGVKCEVEKTSTVASSGISSTDGRDGTTEQESLRGDPEWISLTIEIPGFRDDDALPVFLSSLLTESLVQSGFLAGRLVINARWHWRVYIDILLLSPPLSYPLPLLSMTIHLALLDTKLPRLVSERDDDPLFDDDWAAAISLYSSTPLSGHDSKSRSVIKTSSTESQSSAENPPVTLLTTTVGQKILFDPSREEIAVADAIHAISFASTISISNDPSSKQNLTLLSIRTIDSPARTTSAGLADVDNPATNTHLNTSSSTNNTATPNPSTPTIRSTASGTQNMKGDAGIWNPPVGGISRGILSKIIAQCLGDEGNGVEGVAAGVFEGLKGFVSKGDT